MSESLIAIDSSEIRPGKLTEVKAAVRELVNFVDANEPLPITYNIFIDERETRMTVIQIHPDSASMEHHLALAGPVFSRFSDLITLTSLDIYGSPSQELLEQLKKKVQMLGTAAITLHTLQAGFIRIGKPLGRVSM